MTTSAVSIDDIKQPLIDKLEALLDEFSFAELDAATFFADVLARLRGAEDEQQLLNIFLVLSTTAFRGLHFELETLPRIDALLETAEQISTLFAAPATRPH